MNVNRALVAATLALAVTAPAFAQQTPVVDKREQRQEKRIEEGKASGELTNREAAKLEAGQDRVEAKETAAKSDGVVTKKERASLQRTQNRQSRRVAKQKHDGQAKN